MESLQRVNSLQRIKSLERPSSGSTFKAEGSRLLIATTKVVVLRKTALFLSSRMVLIAHEPVARSRGPLAIEGQDR